MNETAVVIGGGMAGLLATQALSESFQRVRLLDRDYLGVRQERVGVPQAKHLHVMLARGRRAIESLLPPSRASEIMASVLPNSGHIPKFVPRLDSVIARLDRDRSATQCPVVESPVGHVVYQASEH